MKGMPITVDITLSSQLAKLNLNLFGGALGGLGSGLLCY